MTETQTATFDAARALLAQLVPPLVVLKDLPGAYQVTTGKAVAIGNRKAEPVWFAGLATTSKDVTLHFLPVYINPALEAKLPPLFLKVLKGKACFHLGKFDSELQAATREALRLGLEQYRESDYL